jgi:hypothetical protein
VLSLPALNPIPFCPDPRLGTPANPTEGTPTGPPAEATEANAASPPPPPKPPAFMPLLGAPPNPPLPTPLLPNIPSAGVELDAEPDTAPKLKGPFVAIFVAG